MRKEHIVWIDTLKGIGIYLIYVLHLPGNTGNFNLFFSVFGVPLFFFAGGLAEHLAPKRPFVDFVRAKVLRILLPYALFGLLTMAVRVVAVPGVTLGDVIGWIRQLLWGQRNGLFAASLWFLPCYFCLCLYYRLLSMLPAGKKVRLILCAAISLAARYWIDGPLLPWGLDYAARYLFYFALGEILLEPIEQMRKNGLSLLQKLLVGVTGAAALGLNLVNYIYGRGYLPGLFGISLSYGGQVVELIGMALVGLYLTVLVALLLQSVPGLARLGGVSLVLCCTESITKLIVPAAFEAVGLTLCYEQPLPGLLCGALFLSVAYYGAARPIGAYLPWMTGKFLKTSNQQTGKETVKI